MSGGARTQVQAERAAGRGVVPELDYKSISEGSVPEATRQAIRRSGCAVMRGVFPAAQADAWFDEVGDYLERQPLRGARGREAQPRQVFLAAEGRQAADLQRLLVEAAGDGAPGREARRDARASSIGSGSTRASSTPTAQCAYADRVRRRQPGDKTLGLSPHMDAGTVERWIDPGYQQVYERVFAGDWRGYDPFDGTHRLATRGNPLPRRLQHVPHLSGLDGADAAGPARRHAAAHPDRRGHLLRAACARCRTTSPRTTSAARQPGRALGVSRAMASRSPGRRWSPFPRCSPATRSGGTPTSATRSPTSMPARNSPASSISARRRTARRTAPICRGRGRPFSPAARRPTSPPWISRSTSKAAPRPTISPNSAGGRWGSERFLVGWAKRSVPTRCYHCCFRVGTARFPRLCPPYAMANSAGKCASHFFRRWSNPILPPPSSRRCSRRRQSRAYIPTAPSCRRCSISRRRSPRPRRRSASSRELPPRRSPRPATRASTTSPRSARRRRSPGNVAIPLVKALTAKVNEKARGYVHWGATSQDVIDTAFMLLRRRALAHHARRAVRRRCRRSPTLIAAHRDTLMPGRTLMQQALPITFGYKAAVWLSGLTGAAERLRRVEANALALQFGGAAGTLAALGDRGRGGAAALAAQPRARRSRTSPGTPSASRIFDIAAALAGLSGACAKIATDVLLLMQTEVGEAFEPAAAGKGGSSTMPHKRNPVGAVAIRANHRRIAGHDGDDRHRRSSRSTSARPAPGRPNGRRCASSSASPPAASNGSARCSAGLEVDPARMRGNLDATLGLPLAESLMMALAPKIGGRRRSTASRRPRSSRWRAAGRSPRSPRPSRRSPETSPPKRSTAALDPENYLGSADAMIDAALAKRAPRTGERLMARFHDRRRRPHPLRDRRARGRPAAPLLQFARHQPPHVGRRRSPRPSASASASSATTSAATASPRRRTATTRWSGSADDVLELLDALKIDKAAFCGLSMGGMTGIWLAMHHPRRFSRARALQHRRVDAAARPVGRRASRAVPEGGMEAVVDGVVERWFTPAFRAARTRPRWSASAT